MLVALALVALADEPPSWPDGTTLEISGFEPEYDTPAEGTEAVRRQRSGGIALRWNQHATDDQEVVAYLVMRDREQIARLSPEALAWEGVVFLPEAVYSVQAVDARGQVSVDGPITRWSPSTEGTEIPTAATGVVDGFIPYDEATTPPRIRNVGPLEPVEIEGSVLLEIRVDRDGMVVDARVVQPLSSEADAACVTHARTIRFDPARLGDRPVGVSGAPYNCRFVAPQ